MKMTKVLIAVFYVVLLTGLFIGCGLEEEDEEESAAESGTDTTIVVACHREASFVCDQATGTNESLTDAECAGGDVLDECPTENRVATCLLYEGTNSEVTTTWYDGTQVDTEAACDLGSGTHTSY